MYVRKQTVWYLVLELLLDYSNIWYVSLNLSVFYVWTIAMIKIISVLSMSPCYIFHQISSNDESSLEILVALLNSRNWLVFML